MLESLITIVILNICKFHNLVDLFGAVSSFIILTSRKDFIRSKLLNGSNYMTGSNWLFLSLTSCVMWAEMFIW